MAKRETKLVILDFCSSRRGSCRLLGQPFCADDRFHPFRDVLSK